MLQCYCKAGDLVTRSIATETIIVPVRAHVVDLESIYSMDQVGSLIWQLIDERMSVDEIVEAVCASYEVGREQAANDVREFLDTLQAAGLIRSAGAADADKPED